MELVSERSAHVLSILKGMLSRIGARIMHSFELSGYSRAAQHLRSMGYYEEAERCHKMMHDIRLKK